VHIATYKTINYFFDKLMSAVLYMYRFLKKCKSYVRTKSHPEGSISVLHRGHNPIRH
jgi:hypothetical protein